MMWKFIFVVIYEEYERLLQNTSLKFQLSMTATEINFTETLCLVWKSDHWWEQCLGKLWEKEELYSKLGSILLIRRNFNLFSCNYIVSVYWGKRYCSTIFRNCMWHFIINSQLFAMDFSNLQNFVCITASLHVWLCVCMRMCCMHVWEGELSERNTRHAESTSYNLIWMHKPSWKVSMHNRKWILLLSNCVRCPLSAAIHRLFSTVDDFGFGDELTYKQLDSRLLNNDFCPMWIMCWSCDW